MEKKISSSILIDSILIENAKDKSKVLFKSLWEKSDKSLILIHWLRRFGWSLCQKGATDLSASIQNINTKYDNILDYSVIGLSNLDYDIFEDNNYIPNGKIYIDEDKKTYKLMNFTSTGFFSGYGMLNPKVYIEAFKASKQGFKGNMKGDGLQLGGTVIVDNYGNVLYSHTQKNYTDYPQENDLYKFVEDYKFKHKI